MSNDNPVIILINPQMGENIGAAARAMLNFGLIDLRIVAPRDGWPNERAIDMAAGALDQMPEPQIFESLKDAITDLNYTYATTARRRDMVKPIFTPRSANKDAAERNAQTQAIGFVFGPERTGLSNDDLSLCSAAITIPTNPEFSSLNLAQSVLLIAHEWYSAHDRTPDKVMDSGDSRPVEQEKLEEMLTRLESELEAARFFRDEGLKPTMLRNIRNIFTRAELTDQETRTFHGIISALIGKKSP